MSVPATCDALFLRMAELLQALELFEFDPLAERELLDARNGWEQIKREVAAEVGAIRGGGTP